MRGWSLAVVALLLMVWTGCFEAETIVKVRPDGSGTLTETLAVDKTVLKKIGKDFGGAMPSLHDRDKLAGQASEYGTGVTFESSEPIETKKRTGYRAVYAFSDVRTLRFEGSPAPGSTKEEPSNVRQIAFTPGSPAHLELRSAPAEPSVNPPGPTITDEALLEMFEGLHFSLVLDIDGKITNTNATWRDGTKITLADIQFDALLKNPDKLRAISNANPSSAAELHALIGDVDGVRFDQNEALVVEFE